VDAENTIYLGILTTLLALAAAELLFIHRISRRFQLRFAKTYLFYLICTLLFGFFAYIGQNIIWRAVSSLANDASRLKQVFLYFPFISYPFLMIAGFLFVRLFAELVNRRLPPAFVWLYCTVLGLGFAGFGILLTRGNLYQPARFEGFVFWAQAFFVTVQAVILVVAVVLAYRGAQQINLESRRRSIRHFVGIYLVLDLSRISLSIFMEDRLAVALPYLFLFFGGDLIPLTFLQHMLTKHWQRRYEEDIDSRWQSLLVKYDITRRQAEIVYLICQGKTNNQIADELSVTLQTVKTHVHNIFTKTGVKNRVQLTNLFRRS
jgi:DNA-binding CsgD family transcriptional regulator